MSMGCICRNTPVLAAIGGCGEGIPSWQQLPGSEQFCFIVVSMTRDRLSDCVRHLADFPSVEHCIRSWLSLFSCYMENHGDLFVVQLLCPAAVVSVHGPLMQSIMHMHDARLATATSNSG